MSGNQDLERMLFKKTPLYLYSEPDVTLIVGSQKEEMEVHESVVAVYSDFFKAALRSGLKESYEKRIELPEINPDILIVILNWLYRVPLTPLFNPDLDTPETLATALSLPMVEKLNSILRTFDFLQIKNAEVHYIRFLEDKMRGPKPLPDVHGMFSPRVSIIKGLDSVYRYGYCIKADSLRNLFGALVKQSSFAIIWLKEDLAGLQEPDAMCLRDICAALLDSIGEGRKG
ncbi:hypothetical protein TWF730_010307 [Orbilia blumenaviensis]|uniref:BTB domain-containing protein n=1 Tax=Orbilia blumenaviensis TaxID=1796055 RepID=A0AAV9URC2_9PEZI